MLYNLYIYSSLRLRKRQRSPSYNSSSDLSNKQAAQIREQVEIDTKGQDNVAIDKEGLVFRDYNTNKTIERPLNAIAKVELTKPAEDKLESDSSSNSNNSLPIPNIIINDNSKEFKDYIKEEDKLPISPTTNMPPP